MLSDASAVELILWERQKCHGKEDLFLVANIQRGSEVQKSQGLGREIPEVQRQRNDLSCSLSVS